MLTRYLYAGLFFVLLGVGAYFYSVVKDNQSLKLEVAQYEQHIQAKQKELEFIYENLQEEKEAVQIARKNEEELNAQVKKWKVLSKQIKDPSGCFSATHPAAVTDIINRMRNEDAP